MSFKSNTLMLLKCFIILKELRKSERVKISELETLTDSSNKTVRRLRNVLVKAGYNINSKSGKDGGYMLVEPNLSEFEWRLLKERVEGLESVYNKIEYRLLNTF